MNCPVCDGRLRAVEKYGVEIDVCPDCKGIWLDRGELEKIVQMVAQGGPEPLSGGPAPRQEMQYERQERHEDRRPQQTFDDRSREHDHHDREKGHGPHGEYDPKTGKRRQGSWFTEIFDAFGGGGD